jgi:hypothetical protein
MLERMEQEAISLPVLQAIKYNMDYEPFIDNKSPILLLAITDGDTMYLDQAIKQSDSKQFIQAAIDEISTHQKQGHWKVIPKEDVPEEGTKMLDAIWSMKRKRCLLTNQVYKHKARLNVHSGQQEHGVNYWETYAPEVTWAAIRLLLILVIIYKWYTIQIDFVLAYPQADVKCNIYMKIPQDFTIEGKDYSTHVLKLIKNLYGQKQAGQIWNQHLHNSLLELGWRQSNADDCLYYKENILFVVYFADGILISPTQDAIYNELEVFKAKFDISAEGTLSDYVGVNIKQVDDDTIHMSQPNNINSILKEQNFNNDMKTVDTPAYSTSVLGPGTDKDKH